MRSSDDFFPQRPESHGLHLHVNAMASLWFGEFMLPDWDATREPVLLKIFNRNRDCGVVGLFNAGHNRSSPLIGTVGRADDPGLQTDSSYVAWMHREDRLWLCADEPSPVTLAEGEWELASFAPLEQGFAVLGLADKFNSTGPKGSRTWLDDACRIELRGGGSFLARYGRAPAEVLCDGEQVPFVCP